jgi:hypothetical protein
MHWAEKSRFVDSLCGFLGRNLLSKSVSEEVKIRRLKICMTASKEACSSLDINSMLRRLSCLRFDQAPQSIHTAQTLAGWCDNKDDEISRGARQAVRCILPHVQERDEAWIMLAKGQFGLPEDILEDNIAHGDDSVLLVIVLHMIRQLTQSQCTIDDYYHSELETLWLLSKFDISRTVPELQNEFCHLWNQIVLEAQDGRDEDLPSPQSDVLVWIRHLYIALHQGTVAAPNAFDEHTPNFAYICLIHCRILCAPSMLINFITRA